MVRKILVKKIFIKENKDGESSCDINYGIKIKVKNFIGEAKYNLKCVYLGGGGDKVFFMTSFFVQNLPVHPS